MNPYTVKIPKSILTDNAAFLSVRTLLCPEVMAAAAILILTITVINLIIFTFIQRKQVRKLKRALDEEHIKADKKDKFVSNVTHEIRTPLTIISGYAQNLQNSIETMDKAKAEGFAGNIISEINRLSKLISDILLLSRMDQGQIHIETEVLDIAYCINEFAGSLDTLCAEKHIQYALKAHSPTLAMFNYDRFRQLIVILCDNALKFTPEKGEIEIGTATPTELKEMTHDMEFFIANPEVSLQNRIMVYVKDTGCGIPKDKLPHILEHFRTYDTVGGRGSGIGLALIDEMITSIGETVFAASTEGTGSCIGFTLTIANPEEGAENCV